MIKASSIFQRRPLVYGVLYLSLIPIYAILYRCFPSIIGPERSLIDCLYFSTVTITTLGYGDITPLVGLGRLVTASESLLGVVTIGLFLNAVAGTRSDRSQKEQAQRDDRNFVEAQRAKLNGHYGLIRPIIESYRDAVIDITQPSLTPPIRYDPNFELKDMKNLYKPTSLLREHYLRPAVVIYFEAVGLLQKELSDLIKNVDLRCFPAINSQVIQLLESIVRFDYSGAIVSAIDKRVDEKTLAEVVESMLEQYEGNYIPQGANLVNGYIALYHQIRNCMQILQQLERDIQREIEPA